MKAAYITDYADSNDSILVGELPLPELLPDSVVVDVVASSVNPIDNLIRAGFLRQLRPVSFPFILGNDLSGVITAVGSNVTRFKIGDEVFGRPQAMQAGTFAQQCIVKEVDLALKPSILNHEEAASVPLVALTAWQALVEKANLKAGQKILIHAGSGGVGSNAIQLAKYLGAFVATTTSAQNIDFVKALGADVAIDYKDQDFEKVLQDYDVVFDTVGGPTQSKSLSILKKGGCLVAITGTAGIQNLAEKVGVRFELFFMRADGEQLAKIAHLFSERKLRPVIDRRFPLEDIRGALNYSLTGRARGKIVIQVKILQ